MDGDDGYPILVGYDGSHHAGAALAWAQEEAVRCGAAVEVVYVYEWSAAIAPVPVGSCWPDSAVRREAVAAVQEAVAQARRTRPEVMVRERVVDGTVVSALRKLAERARLVVLGNRGLGGLSDPSAGSVAMGVATHAPCPVVIVRGCARSRLPVAVGVDRSVDCEHAIRFAFEQACAFGSDLLAVRAWQPPPVPHRRDVPAPTYDREHLVATERCLTEQMLVGWRDKDPAVGVSIQLAPTPPVPALIEASSRASLVVVGARGRGGFRDLLLGSVARQLIQHAHCPVAVVRASAPPGPVMSARLDV